LKNLAALSCVCYNSIS